MRTFLCRQKGPINCIFLIFLLLAVLGAFPCFADTEYIYFTNGGAGSEDGSSCANGRAGSWFNSSSNWSSMDETANKIDPGDICYFCDDGGDFNMEFDFQGSGSASGGYITMQNAPGETPIVDGTGLGTGVLMIDSLNNSYVKVVGMTVRNFQGGGITLRASNEAHSHLEIRDNEVYNQTGYESTDIQKTVYVSSSSSGTGSITDVVVDGNYIHDVSQGVAGLHDECLAIGFDINRFQVTNNTLENYTYIGIVTYGRHGSYCPRNGYIADNEVDTNTESTSAGIYIDGAEDTCVENNYVHDNTGMGICLGEETSGDESKNIICRFNRVYNCSNLNFMVGSGNDPGGLARNCRVVHNVSYGSGSRNIAFYNGTNNIVKNNISYADAGTVRHIGHWAFTDLNPELNYNCYYPDITNGYQYKGTIYSNFSNCQSGTGQDANSFAQDPKLVNPPGDFSLQADSPCINAGGFLTKTTSSGSGKTLVVQDARYFTNGYGVIEGDLIQVGSNNPVRVTSIDYDTNTVTLNTSISWNSGDGVSYPYSGSRPDIGAYEYGGKAPPGPEPPGTDLVLLLQFDECSGTQATDSSGNDNHGTINGATWTNNSISGNALEFDGIDDYVEHGDQASLNFGTNDFTLEAWVKADSNQQSYTCIIEKGNPLCDGCPPGYALSVDGGKIRFSLDGSSNLGDVDKVYVDALPYLDNQWHHIAGIRNASNIYLYLDGLQVASGPNNLRNVDVSANLWIGYGKSFNGIIDEVRIYNRALSAEEILEHYNAANIPAPPTGLTITIQQ